MTAHLDREKAREVAVNLWDDGNAVGLDGWAGVGAGRATTDPEAEGALNRAVGKTLDALEACVVPDPPTSIDRDALAKLLYGRGLVPADRVTEVCSRVLALVRPVDGVTLTREEALEAASWIEIQDERTRPLLAKLKGKA